MPSSFSVKRNYSNCPLKKRPFALHNEPASSEEQQEPEDLSVKRPRYASPPPRERTPKLFTNQVEKPVYVAPENAPRVPPIYPEVSQQSFLPVSRPVNLTTRNFLKNPNNSHVINPTPVKFEAPTFKPVEYVPKNREKLPENVPSLAEYYLQLFKATSEAESKAREMNLPNTTWHKPAYFPPSPQNSPSELSKFSPRSESASPYYFGTSPLSHYPESSALISPVSLCSESEEEPSSTTHLNPVRPGSRYSCESCGKSYSTQSGLRKHCELHCSSLGPREFSCKHCSKGYTSIGALKMHIRTHTLPCKCNVCGKAFSRPWLLQGHIRTHTGEKPFECQQCNRSFADRSNLRAHQQTHEHVKKYKCNSCNKTFSRMSLLNKHLENSCVAVKLISSSNNRDFSSIAQ